MTGEFQANEERMTKYLEKVKKLLDQFKSCHVTQIPISKNNEVDALARLASGIDINGLVSFPIELLNQPSIEQELVLYSEKTST